MNNYIPLINTQKNFKDYEVVISVSFLKYLNRKLECILPKHLKHFNLLKAVLYINTIYSANILGLSSADMSTLIGQQLPSHAH